ncbi:glycoside hydrolase [Crucibulum laeve]|uniref:AA9 family lytic polysaccharide monooxygenase n=1 Tax=Crucibulum laeve TaxID=68775 RepID=A0A5C3LNT1_9AGAR|nr:glycoside hydrolase [Crucibulum laeve]
MKLFSIFGLALIAQTVSAHYIFNTLITESTNSTNAVRQPQDSMPIHAYYSGEITCNVNSSPASETVEVKAGDRIGFHVDQKLYHKGPVAIYLGQAPGKVADWDGAGQRWFKIAEWGPTFNPFSFTSLNKDEFMTTIPKSIPSGKYLVRIEQAGLHLTGTLEFFVSCAQIKVTGGGNGKLSMVSIPGYIPKNDPSMMVST